tara:strand:+ start:1799 stop:2647 length:849 start_codon:yes stop_codon:yes gene_type:complete
MVQWFEERLYNDFSALYRVGSVVYQDKSEHQDLIIFDHDRFGRILALDSIVQLTTSDEFIYHEMMSHLPILAHGAAKRVLIIGGGDGGVLRHCLMHKSVEQVTLVEIDQSVIDLSLEYLPMISAGAYDDPRANVIITDGAKFVAETDEKFDVIIIDSTDPVGPGRVLFDPSFYKSVVGCLTEQGVVVTQSGVPLWEPESSKLTHDGLKPLVADFGFTRAPVPTYVGGDMLLGWGCKSPAVRQTPVEELRKRYADSGIVTKFYTPDVHVGAFALPPSYLTHLG